MRDFFERVVALRRERRPFAMATVVGRRGPVSAHRGDRAIVYADGRMDGFVGGACLREIVRKQALECLRTGEPRLLSVQPEAGPQGQDGRHVVVPMTCVSEGAVDVYVEPSVRPRRLVVVGATEVAEALTRTALTLDYDVVRVVEGTEVRDLEASSAALGFAVAPLESLRVVLEEGGRDSAVVVVSQGHYDELALETILPTGAAYVGLVASRKRGESVRQWLDERGVSGVEAIRHPAGLDLGAQTAPEVAISILAELVQRRLTEALVAESPKTEDTALPATAIDPVCGMEVEIARARHSAEHAGTAYYFCCPHCRSAFLKDPASFLAPAP